VVLRSMWVYAPVVWLLLAAAILGFERGDGALPWFAWVVLADGAVTYGMLALFRTLPNARTDDDVRGAVRAYFFVAWTLCSSPVAVGFVGLFVSGRPLSVVLGLAVGAMLLRSTAPTAGELDRLDRTLRERGLSVRAHDALGGS